MSTEAPRKRRRSLTGDRMDGRVTVSLDAVTTERLAELSDRYNVARGTIAREAIGAGLKAVHERMRRAARSAARDRHADADAQ